jgi:hypothetical protein
VAAPVFSPLCVVPNCVVLVAVLLLELLLFYCAPCAQSGASVLGVLCRQGRHGPACAPRVPCVFVALRWRRRHGCLGAT